MRQQHHQKSRGRGRGRKQQNPMSRNFESNGPDVKIRGNAAHIAEKYSTLARDALSNGDRVIAENYLQHAEHYNRIVAAAQAQNPQQNRNERQENDSESGDENSAPETVNGSGQQPDVAATDQADERPAKSKQNGTRRAKSDDSAEETGSEANGASSNDDPEEGGKEKRKTTRARRPRKQAEATGNSEEQPDVPVEAISDDAAKLPESITGGMLAEEG